jgi:adenine-specific DNA-methyltransferase
MKYMGSKRNMLNNGLGKLLLEKTSKFNRFVDLFTGGGVVSWFVAEKVAIPVLAVDLQRYATILAETVITRTKPLDVDKVLSHWLPEVIEKRNSSSLWEKARTFEAQHLELRSYVYKARELCKQDLSVGPLWSAYGGHYFCPTQALTFDYLLNNLPVENQDRLACLAACIAASSECVASPGHTAQPFQPTEGAGKYIMESWRKDPLKYVQKNLEFFCSKFAQVKGKVITTDAQNVLSQLNPGDLVFIDPPYSGVQYSRFYHVLEVIAKELKHVSVSGVGRYPSLDERPQSKFSNISQAKNALKLLLQGIAERGSTIVFTYPTGDSSNGLSGDIIKGTASMWFTVEDMGNIEGQFSTLGGNNGNRNARYKSDELILFLKPL